MTFRPPHQQSFQEQRLLSRLGTIPAKSPPPGSGDAATFLILLMDRSSTSMSQAKSIMKSLDDSGRRDLFPPDVRAWFESPVLGHYMCLVINRLDITSAYIADDDFFDLMEAAHPMVGEFCKRSSAVASAGHKTWIPLLCKPMHEAFERWYNDH